MQPLLSERNTWSSWTPFRETNFSSCERLERVVRDAFETWSRASPALQFVDVTDRCRTERLWDALPEEHCVLSPMCKSLENQTDDAWHVSWTYDNTPLELSNPAPDQCSHRTCWDCPRADVVVGAFSQKNRQLGDQHARARVVRGDMTAMRPVGADGRPKPGGYLTRAFVQFNADDKYMDNGTALTTCWKLESDVCDWVAGTGEWDVEADVTLWYVLLMMLISCCCCCAILCCLRTLAYNLLSGYDLDKDGVLSCSEYTYVLDEFIGDMCFLCRCPQIHGKDVSQFVGGLTVVETFGNMQILFMSICWTVGVAIIVVYGLEFQACWECWDLAAAATHEVGHVLSLGHPRAPDGLSLSLFNASEIPDEASFSLFNSSVEPEDEAETSRRILKRGSGGGGGEASDGGGPGYPAMPPLPPSPPPRPPSPPPLPYALYEQMAPWCDDPAQLANRLTLRHPNDAYGGVPPIKLMGRAEKLSLNDSVMAQFDVKYTDRTRPPGKGRRCLSQDDLDGINWLYPTCEAGAFAGLQHPPPCEGTDAWPEAWPYVWQRLLLSIVKIAMWLVVGLVGIKLLAFCFLEVEEWVAHKFVDQNAKLLLQVGPGAVDPNVNPLSAVFRSRYHDKRLKERMVVKMQKAFRARKARRELERRRLEALGLDEHTQLAAAKLQALVRGRASRDAVGPPGSKKARLFKMRLQMAKLNQRQQAIGAGARSRTAMVPFAGPTAVMPHAAGPPGPRWSAEPPVSGTRHGLATRAAASLDASRTAPVVVWPAQID